MRVIEGCIEGLPGVRRLAPEGEVDRAVIGALIKAFVDLLEVDCLVSEVVIGLTRWVIADGCESDGFVEGWVFYSDGHGAELGENNAHFFLGLDCRGEVVACWSVGGQVGLLNDSAPVRMGGQRDVATD